MNLERDLQKLRKEKQLRESAIAQLRKRSKDSVDRPRAEKNILSTRQKSIFNIILVYYKIAKRRCSFNLTTMTKYTKKLYKHRIR